MCTGLAQMHPDPHGEGIQSCRMKPPCFCCSQHNIHHEHSPALLTSYIPFKPPLVSNFTHFSALLNCSVGQNSGRSCTTAHNHLQFSSCYENITQRFPSQASSKKQSHQIIILSPRQELMFFFWTAPLQKLLMDNSFMTVKHKNSHSVGQT